MFILLHSLLLLHSWLAASQGGMAEGMTEEGHSWHGRQEAEIIKEGKGRRHTVPGHTPIDYLFRSGFMSHHHI